MPYAGLNRLSTTQVIAFLFESGLDFEKGCHVSKIKDRMLGAFHGTCGQRLELLFKADSQPASVQVDKPASVQVAGQSDDSLGRERSLSSVVANQAALTRADDPELRL